jgi:hypothetical protein
MVFEPHKHVFRTMSNKDDETNEHSSFITFLGGGSGGSGGSSSGEFCKYRCELCDKILPKLVLKHHCQSKSHVSRVKQVQRMQCNPAVRKTAAYQRRIDGLGLPAWQEDVQAKLYWVLLYQDVSERPQVIQMKAAADAILAKYERMEIVSLLELAVWKAICIVSPQQPRATTTNSHSSKSDCNVVQKFDYHTWQEWSRQGWKSVKASLRKSNEIGIIITLVLPFLIAESRDDSASDLAEEEEKGIEYIDIGLP